MSFLNRLTFVSFISFTMLSFAGAASTALGEKIYNEWECSSVGDICQNDNDCQREENCPDCVTCEVDPSNPTISRCVPNDFYCQNMSGGDGPNNCRESTCNPRALIQKKSLLGKQVDTSGCENLAPVITDPYDHDTDDFDVPCFECDDAKPMVACGNGICNANVGENAFNCRVDCGEVEDPISSQSVLDAQCNLLIPIIPRCNDYDKSTMERCRLNPLDKFSFVCEVVPTEPSEDYSDLVCALGAEGPKAPRDKGKGDGERSCDRSDLGPWCDIDCWPGIGKSKCGNPYVELGETCDDGLPDPEYAGTGPNDSLISKAACRDPDTEAECTACGDGVLQPLVEQCDFAAEDPNSMCPTDNICLKDCTCAEDGGDDGGTTTTTTTTTGGDDSATGADGTDGNLDGQDTFGPIVDETGDTGTATGNVSGSGCSLGSLASGHGAAMSLTLFAMILVGSAMVRVRSKK